MLNTVFSKVVLLKLILQSSHARLKLFQTYFPNAYYVYDYFIPKGRMKQYNLQLQISWLLFFYGKSEKNDNPEKKKKQNPVENLPEMIHLYN